MGDGVARGYRAFYSKRSLYPFSSLDVSTFKYYPKEVRKALQINRGKIPNFTQQTGQKSHLPKCLILYWNPEYIQTKNTLVPLYFSVVFYYKARELSDETFQMFEINNINIKCWIILCVKITLRTVTMSCYNYKTYSLEWRGRKCCYSTWA